MEKFFSKIKKLERKHQHELAMLCGAAAVLLLIGGFIAGSIPTSTYAWIITVSPSYTPVQVGGNTTISWTAPTSDFCNLIAPVNVTNMSGETCFSSPTVYDLGSCDNYGNCSGGSSGPPYTTQCYVRVNGANGSVTVGPINTSYTYSIQCNNVSGGFGSSQGAGGASITVAPSSPAIPSTFNSFTATSPSISSGGSTNLHWSYTPGNNFYGCEIVGGNWPSGYYWLPATDSGVNNNTGALSANTTYQINCYDSQNGWGAWHPLTVAVTAPVQPAGPCTDIPAVTAVPNGCVTPSPTPGICTPTGGSYSAGTNTCSCPAGQHLSGAACVPNALCSNGLADSYAPSCTCPAGQYQPLGASSCVALPVCANGLNQSYSPSCQCPSGQVQVRGGSTCVTPGVINSLTANPSRVLKGNSTTISWSTSGMSICSLSAFNANGTSALSSALNSSLQQTVAAKTVYTLSCTDASGTSYASSVTLNLIPVTVEQ